MINQSHAYWRTRTAHESEISGDYLVFVLGVPAAPKAFAIDRQDVGARGLGWLPGHRSNQSASTKPQTII